MDNVCSVAAVYAQNYQGNTRRTVGQALAIAAKSSAELKVVGIFPACGGEYAEMTEQLYRYAAGIGAEMTVLYSREPALALLDYVRNSDITELVISESDSSGAARLISDVLPGVNVTLASAASGSVCNLFAADLFCCVLLRA